MKKFLLIIFMLGLIFGGIYLYYNKDKIPVKENYYVYAFQVGAYESYDLANSIQKNLPTSIIRKDDNLYKVYVAIYKDVNVVNKMLVYYEDNDININLKSLNVSKNFYREIDKYEQIILKSEEVDVYKKVSQSILDLFVESTQNV